MNRGFTEWNWIRRDTGQPVKLLMPYRDDWFDLHVVAGERLTTAGRAALAADGQLPT